jgi:hypothetical protein
MDVGQIQGESSVGDSDPGLQRARNYSVGGVSASPAM